MLEMPNCEKSRSVSSDWSTLLFSPDWFTTSTSVSATWLSVSGERETY